jgi:two-component system CheB/CheR fusion protein
MDIEHTEGQGEAVAMPEKLGFPIVGIGASAGGFQALDALLRNMPPDPGMALVVILHLGSGPSAADKVLQRATTMPVVQVSHTMPILPGKVYVIPPDRSLKMDDGHLVLDELARRTTHPVAIDIFLRTLAMAHGEDAVGVVLSGMGSDGTAGLACIKEMGGVTIAQLPADAEEGAMPRSAIESGMADFVLAAREIPRKLVELRDIARRIRERGLGGHPPGEGPLFDLGAHPQAVLSEVLAQLRARTGHDFSHYRRPTLQRRLERRLQVRGLPDATSYCRLLREDAGEAQALLKDLLIGVTGFFRDRDAFAALESQVVPELFRSLPPGTVLRAWVAACSTGEEATPWPCCWPGMRASAPGCRCSARTSTSTRSRSDARACTRPRLPTTCRRSCCSATSRAKAASTRCARSCATSCCSRPTTCCTTPPSAGSISSPAATS